MSPGQCLREAPGGEDGGGELFPLLHLVVTPGGWQHASSLEMANVERTDEVPDL